MEKLTRLRTGGLGLALAALMLAGCQTTLLLDDNSLEPQIATWIAEQGVGTATVVCPEDRPLQQGDVFQCVATFDDGSIVMIEVTQTDNTGNVSWRALAD